MVMARENSCSDVYIAKAVPWNLSLSGPLMSSDFRRLGPFRVYKMKSFKKQLVANTINAYIIASCVFLKDI